jgi:hypothetical protein
MHLAIGYIYIFFPLVLRPDAGNGLMLEVSRSYTTHHSRLDSSGRAISSPQRLLPDWHTTLTANILALSGIRAHNSSRRTTADVRRHRPLGHWCRLAYGHVVFCVSYKRYCYLNNISNIQWTFQLSPLFKNNHYVSAATFFRWFLLKTESGSFRNVVFLNIGWQWKKS